MKEWDESCDKPPQVLQGSNTVGATDESHVDSLVKVNSERISYTNSKPRFSFNRCHHLKEVIGLGGLSKLTLRKEWYYDDTQEYEGGCGTNDWTHRVTSGAYELELHLSNTLLGEGADPVAISSDPYLPIGTDYFTDKVKDLDRIALRNFVTSLDTGFSMPLFLAEIFETKALWGNIQAFWQYIVSDVFLLSRRGNARKDMKRLLNKPLNSLGDSWLSLHFGWLPFVRDVQTIFSKLFSARNLISEFLDNAGKRRTLHYRKPLSHLTFHDAGWFEATNSGSFELETANIHDDWHWAEDVFSHLQFSISKRREVKELFYHATIDYSYNVPDYGAFLTRFLAELDHWGINLSVSDVWNAIPFSFVVDWVFDVGARLQFYDRVNLPVQVEIYDFCRSFKYRYSEDVILSDLEQLALTHGDYQDVNEWTVHPSSGLMSRKDIYSYYRLPGLPQLAADNVTGFRTPKGFYLVTAPALLEQKIKRRRKPRRIKSAQPPLSGVFEDPFYGLL